MAFTTSFSKNDYSKNYNFKKEIILTWFGIVFTGLATLMTANELLVILSADFSNKDYFSGLINLLLLIIVSALIYGGLVYQFARLKYLERLSIHKTVSDKELSKLFTDNKPKLSVLIPSYKEERLVVEMTLMSAALQDFPDKNVVLLLDDPYYPENLDDSIQLAAMRQLPIRLNNKFSGIRKTIEDAKRLYNNQFNASKDNHKHYAIIAELYLTAANWVENQKNNYEVTDAASKVFVEKVLDNRFSYFQEKANHFLVLSERDTNDYDSENFHHQIELEYERLLSNFSVTFSIFERKKYENLSHEANKAMNLNSYLGLMGKGFIEKIIDNQLHLIEVSSGDSADIAIPSSDYVLTLDADSIILPSYALLLTHQMEKEGNEKLAVIQTPYSAFPDPGSLLERVAGATTDIQYIIHQGFTGFDATYWVGANALLRRSALEDIAETDVERGYVIKRYIQDRTVIEDTESTIDLVDKGWSLYNYPDRLAYSATPPDYGSFLIQRRRWANGGLIILPKLLKRIFGFSKTKASFGEAFMRIHYLVSIAAVNIGLIIMLAFPITSDIETMWLPLTALPYFTLYARDLKLTGYNYSDLFRVYALNLLLIPINLGGVFKSIQQGLTKTKIPFGRTPKVAGRTAAPAFYILAEFLLVFQWMLGAGVDLYSNHWGHAAFALINSLILTYAIFIFMGLRESLEDLSVQTSQFVNSMFKAKLNKQKSDNAITTVEAERRNESTPITFYDLAMKCTEEQQTGLLDAINKGWLLLFVRKHVSDKVIPIIVDPVNRSTAVVDFHGKIASCNQLELRN